MNEMKGEVQSLFSSTGRRKCLPVERSFKNILCLLEIRFVNNRQHW